MAKNKKNKQKQNANLHSNTQSKQNPPKAEKSPEILALERKISELANKKRELENQKANLNKQKQQAEKIANQTVNEHETAQKELDKLKNESFEIREAVRNIEELALAKYSEQANAYILALLGVSEQNTSYNSQNDNAILAVALRHKLTDVVLYSDDKNLKNKATAYDIQTA